MKLHASPRHTADLILDDLELGWRAAVLVCNENVDKWGPWVSPEIFEARLGGVVVESSAPPHPWHPRKYGPTGRGWRERRPGHIPAQRIPDHDTVALR